MNANYESGPGLNIVHLNGVYLNAKSIGCNFTVYPGALIGAAGTDSSNKGLPLIEDNVTIYTGAVVVGGIILHSNCAIGANSYVGRDISENAIVAGLPAKTIKFRN